MTRAPLTAQEMYDLAASAPTLDAAVKAVVAAGCPPQVARWHAMIARGIPEAFDVHWGGGADDPDRILPPTVFRASVGGGATDGYSCELAGGIVSYMPWGNATESPALLEITPAEWGLALRLLKAFGVERWRHRYEPDALVLDGTHWSLEIASPLVTVQSTGDNTYPPRFSTAMTVISALMGGRTFR